MEIRRAMQLIYVSILIAITVFVIWHAPSQLMAEEASAPALTRIWSLDDDDFYLEMQSLSPDGTKLVGIHIAMDAGQNVAYKDLTTGKCEFITNFDWESEGHGFTARPVWSPDGQEVAFNFCGFSDNIWELRIADIEEASRTIFRCESEGQGMIYPCKWFPDGDKILAIHITSDNVVQLGILSVQGGNFEVLYEPDIPAGAKFQPDAYLYFQADLSPDGKRVVFHRADDESKHLYVMDIASKTVKALTDGPARDSEPFWSPDGGHIAFLSNRGGGRALWGMPVDKDGNCIGKPYPILDSMEYASLSNWTVNGIAYSNWVTKRDIYTMAVDPQTGAPAGKPERLDFQPTGSNMNPIYSPDGRFIAFVINPPDDPPVRKIAICPVSGGEARIFQVPSRNLWVALHDLRWLPDGSGISFCGTTSKETPGWQEGARAHRLFHLDLGSGEWRTLSLEGESGYNRSEWRGDGKGIYYTSIMKEGGWGIAEKDMQTGDKRKLCGVAPGLYNLKCSRDYAKLAFSCNRGGIEIIDAVTGEQLKEFGEFELSAWSPDGRHIIARKGSNQSYHVISCADGASQEYNLSEYFPDADRWQFDWSPIGDQLAFSFRLRKFDAYLICDIIPADKK